MDHKLDHFDDLFAEPVATVPFTRVLGRDVKDLLGAEGLARKAERGAHTESDTYRKAFHDRLRGIADAVVRVLRDSVLARSMAAAGRRKAELYAWSEITRRLETLYLELVGRRERIRLAS